MKKSVLIFGAALICAFLIVGCVPKQIYYFGNYSSTLYALEKDNNEAAMVAHKQELEKIIAESAKRNLQVPPGINAELGFMYVKENQPDKAISLFQAEAALYPESTLLMQRLVQMAEKKKSEPQDTLSATEATPSQN